MDTLSRDELHALRARAYGPAADIEGDPEALRRLRDLEGKARGQRVENADTPQARGDATASDAAPAQDAAEQTAPSGPRQSSAPSGETARPASPAQAPRTLRSWLIPLLVLVLAVGVTVAVTAATVALTRTEGAEFTVAAPKIATLEPDPSLVVPEGFMGVAVDSLVYDFHGLTLFTAAEGFPSTGDTCFMVVASADVPDTIPSDGYSWSSTSPTYSGCTAAAFPAIAQFTVTEAMPEEFRAAFPEGTGVMFVLNDGRIDVYRSDAEESVAPQP
ncbi:hypothetical protein JOD63_002732 [Microbacterium terrae]|uniref:Uncharacterized protein n=1 Tax=Microbacterium terrae TaxID=69369 RepID=A0A0M2HC97_9MICO|nr:hypothetical protein [Microbacterium terrae]KJL44224.1 hypothetical protein RS81_00554 [Microbacterium terrae]MBP1078764.1 hypothetical protein [Microbacterium terrae]GLJ98165.1 hypothetical protein GCM10017594_13620 [Microbacterium terrae]